ncbi:MAG: hydrogenase expression/formation protein HypE, partial [Trichloromonas sp.]|nr:hydrogenase expression/formation protein HypE [Trichloromonas sp.]
KEIARQSQVRIELDENALPIQPAVAGACALLERMRRHAQGQGTALIGEVTEGPPGQVHLRTTIGGRRAIEMLAGEQLPRIC